MKTKVKKISDSRIEITVTLDAEDLKPAKKKALEKLAKEVKVEGFRKGKVPTDVAQKFIPENDLNAETVDFAVRSTVIEAFKNESKAPLVLPSVNVTKYVPDEVVEYTATADIVPEVKLGDYKKLGVKKPEAKVAEKDIKEVLENIRTSFAEKKVAWWRSRNRLCRQKRRRTIQGWYRQGLQTYTWLEDFYSWVWRWHCGTRTWW